MEIKQVRHDWPEEADFHLSRPSGAQEYVLLHFHNSVELYFGNRRYVTQPGALILFSPGEPHRFLSREPLLHDWMHLTGPVREEAAAFGIARTRFTSRLRRADYRAGARLEAEFFARRSHWQALAQALMTELWVLLCRDLTRETPAPVALETADRLRALLAPDSSAPELPWDNATMARQINLSVSRLYPPLPPHVRPFTQPRSDPHPVEKAKNMLLQGETVARTAACLGYANVSHFNRQFQAGHRVPPGRYGQAERSRNRAPVRRRALPPRTGGHQLGQRPRKRQGEPHGTKAAHGGASQPLYGVKHLRFLLVGDSGPVEQRGHLVDQRIFRHAQPLRNAMETACLRRPAEAARAGCGRPRRTRSRPASVRAFHDGVARITPRNTTV
jgi:hypothetical protein